MRIVLPLLEQQNRPARTGLALGNEDDAGRFDEGWVLGSVDEAGQVEVVPVRPARGLLSHGCNVPERRDRAPSYVEDDVVSAAREPEHRVVLRRGHDVAV
jgi:hypothetical protein